MAGAAKAEIVGHGWETGSARTIASETFCARSATAARGPSHANTTAARFSRGFPDPMRPGGYRHASSRGEESVADGERRIEGELPPHRTFAGLAPFVEDRLASRDRSCRLEVDHGGTMFRHRRDRRQHRRAEDERERTEDNKPAPGSRDDEKSRQAHLNAGWTEYEIARPAPAPWPRLPHRVPRRKACREDHRPARNSGLHAGGRSGWEPPDGLAAARR